MVILQTERLTVRDELESDLADMHRLFSDEKTMYFLDDICTHSMEETAAYLKTGMANADGHYFSLCDKLTGAFMGNVGYTITAVTPFGKIVHMGYFMLPEYHGHGYMPEAVKKVIAFAFTQDDCFRITTGCYKDNEPSRKVMEKAGFRKEGERIKAQYHDGAMKDRLDYAINKEDYMRGITMLDEVKKQLSEYEIKPITKENFEQAFEVYESNQDFFLLTQGEKTTIDASINDMTALPPGCDASQKMYVSIWKNGRVIGVLDLIEKYPEQNCFWVGLLLIHGALRGKNIGSRVVTAILNAATVAGYTSAQLGVIDSNVKGLNFWKKHGFEVTRQAENIVVMERPCSAR